MENMNEIDNKILTLKKRLREPDMKEIFESKTKSIVEVYLRVTKNNQSQR